MAERILVTDDNGLMRQLLSDSLTTAGYEVVTASSGLVELRELEQQSFDLIISDVEMPDMDGYELAREVRQNTRTAHLPVIMLTSRSELNDKLTGLESGADDYLAKPIAVPELLARVKAQLRRSRVAISMNPLTGLPGNQMIEQHLKKTVESGNPFSVLYVDLDFFKAYNDRYGFLRGDVVIRFTGELLQAVVRELGQPCDLVGHIGGDDFIVVTTPERAALIGIEVVDKFNRQVSSFYDPADRAQGYITYTNRSHQVVDIPLLSVSIAVVDNLFTGLDSHWALSERAAEAKAQAKGIQGSSLYFWRPRDLPANVPVALVLVSSEASMHFVDRILSGLGFAVAKAVSGNEVVLEAGAHKPDLVVLGEGSHWMAKKVKSQDSLKDVPLLLVGLEDGQAPAEQSTADGIVWNPVSTETLVAAVFRLCPRAARVDLPETSS